MPRTPMPPYTPTGRKPTPSSPTPAERAASKAQDERLKRARVTPKEGRVIESANRSEGGGGMNRGGSIRSRGFGLPDSMLPRGTESRRPQAPSQTTKPSASTTAPQTVKPTPPKTETVKINEKPKYVKLNPHKKGGMVMKKASKAGNAMMKKSADTMGRAMKMNKGGKCYAGGGLVGGHKSADGIAKKGKTRGKMC